MASIIAKQLAKRRIKRDNDVEELYLSDCNLSEVPELSKFSHLQSLWLDGNKLLHVGFKLKLNYILTELYLQKNLLKELHGSLHHLTCLKILLLHGNQLTMLSDLLHEFRNLHALKVLSLHGNPLSQDYYYRTHVVHSLPSLELFDRKAITEEERDKVAKQFDAYNQSVRQTIAFGTRVPGAPTRIMTSSTTTSRMNNTDSDEGAESSDQSLTVQMEQKFLDRHTSPEDRYANLIDERARKRSIMQFSRFNWIQILEQREKLGTEYRETDPVVFTSKFR